MKKRINIYELNELIVRPEGRSMVWVYLVWCIYDGKAELRGIGSTQGRAQRMSKMFRHEFEFFGRDVRGRLRVKIDCVEVDHAMGACMTTLHALDLDPKLQESREKYLKMAEDSRKRTDDYLAMVRKKAKERGILS